MVSSAMYRLYHYLKSQTLLSFNHSAVTGHNHFLPAVLPLSSEPEALAHPPLIASNSKKRTTIPTNPNVTTRITRNMHQQQALVVPALLTGLDESIPVVGTVINYNYAH